MLPDYFYSISKNIIQRIKHYRNTAALAVIVSAVTTPKLIIILEQHVPNRVLLDLRLFPIYFSKECHVVIFIGL